MIPNIHAPKATHGDQHEHCWKQTPEPPPPERQQSDAAAFGVAQQQRRDEEAGQGEEQVDAEEPALQVAGVEQEHGDDRGRAQTVERGQVLPCEAWTRPDVPAQNRAAPAPCPPSPRPSSRSSPALADSFADGGVLDDADEGTETVTPSDLLALGVGAPGVRDADLVDAQPRPAPTWR